MDQDARVPGKQRRHDMATPLARPGAAGHQAWPEVGCGENLSPENAENAASSRRQTGGPGVLETAPAPDTSMRFVAYHRPQPQSRDAAEQNQRCAAGNRRLGFCSKRGAPSQDGPGRIERKIVTQSEGRPKNMVPLVGPGEDLRGHLGTHEETERQSCQPRPHVRTPEAGCRGQPRIPGSARAPHPCDDDGRLSGHRPSRPPTAA